MAKKHPVIVIRERDPGTNIILVFASSLAETWWDERRWCWRPREGTCRPCTNVLKCIPIRKMQSMSVISMTSPPWNVRVVGLWLLWPPSTAISNISQRIRLYCIFCDHCACVCTFLCSCKCRRFRERRNSQCTISCEIRSRSNYSVPAPRKKWGYTGMPLDLWKIYVKHGMKLESIVCLPFGESMPIINSTVIVNVV